MLGAIELLRGLMAKLINIHKFHGQKIKTGEIIALHISGFRAGRNVAGERKGILFALKSGTVRYQTRGRKTRKRTYISVIEKETA